MKAGGHVVGVALDRGRSSKNLPSVHLDESIEVVSGDVVANRETQNRSGHDRRSREAESAPRREMRFEPDVADPARRQERLVSRMIRGETFPTHSDTHSHAKANGHPEHVESGTEVGRRTRHRDGQRHENSGAELGQSRLRLGDQLVEHSTCRTGIDRFGGTHQPVFE